MGEAQKKDGEIQCHRCQRWGHTAKNCNSHLNCVKCDTQHKPGECTRIRSDTSDPFCVNCGETGHPANWKGCPTYKKYIATRQQKIDKAREDKATAINTVNRAVNSISPEKSFANLFQPRANQQSKPPIVEHFLSLAKYILEPEELTVEQEIGIFLEKYQNMSKPEAKTEFLRLLNKVRNSYGP